MPSSRYLLFVSSVQRELAAERRAVKDFVDSDPHPSIPRNPLLAESLFLARYIERAGTGTLDMAVQCKEAGLQPLQFRMEHGQFIQMLPRLMKAAGEVTPQVTQQVTPQVTPQVEDLVRIATGEHSREELQTLLDLADRENFRLGYLLPALAEGLVERTIPDKPQSRLQRYRLTPSGAALQKQLKSARSQSDDSRP